jgi:hypothetical protein
LTPEQLERLRAAQQQEQADRPQAVEQYHRLSVAAEEQSLSGALRRAIHRGDLPLPVLAERANVAVMKISEFLGGEAPLASDEMDRIAAVLGYRFTELEQPATAKD